MNELISIIIPVFNTEKYLEECIESMMFQTYKNIEIILVDDGSVDKSGDMCDDYAKKDLRIKVIHKSNSGQADARNIGIQNTHGIYLMFADSDDVVREDYVECLYNALINNKADIVCSPYKKIYYRNEINVRENDSEKNIQLSNVEALKRLLYQDKIFHTGTVGKIFKKEFFDDVIFPSGLYYEDLGTVYKLLSKANSVVGIEKYLYGYRIRKDSTMRQGFNRKKLSCIVIGRELYDTISKSFSELIPAVATRCFSLNRAIFWQTPNNIKDIENIWEEICKYRNIVLKNREARLRDRLMAAMSFLGKDFFHIFSLLYKIQQMGKIH